MKQLHTPSKSRKGFSLLEVVLALALAGIVMIGISYTFDISLLGITKAQEITKCNLESFNAQVLSGRPLFKKVSVDSDTQVSIEYLDGCIETLTYSDGKLTVFASSDCKELYIPEDTIPVDSFHATKKDSGAVVEISCGNTISVLTINPL